MNIEFVDNTVLNALLSECDFLGAGQLESLAHLLASVHLQLRLTEEVFANNTDYHYYVERYIIITSQNYFAYFKHILLKFICTV